MLSVSSPEQKTLHTALALGGALCLLLALSMPNMVIPADVHTDAGQVRWLEATGLGAVFWLLCAALLGRLWLVLALAVPVALFWPLELWLRLYNGTPISPQLAALALESNWAVGRVAAGCALAPPLARICAGHFCTGAGVDAPIPKHA